MSNRRLFIFVEGTDDERFFSRIVKPLFSPTYSSVELIMYACMKSARVCKFIRGIRAMGHDFILVADIDEEPGVRAKKRAIQERLCAVESGDIMIIIKEIESWYLAGIDREHARTLGVRAVHATDQITKEDFNRMIPSRYPSRIVFMLDLISSFSIQTALTKNRSFRFFMGRYHLMRKGADEDLTERYPGKRVQGSRETSAGEASGNTAQ